MPKVTTVCRIPSHATGAASDSWGRPAKLPILPGYRRRYAAMIRKPLNPGTRR
jgi:hypothetical protein